MTLAKKLTALGLIVLLLSGVGYHYVVDGVLPEEASYSIDLTQLRKLASEPAELRPNAIEFEIVSYQNVPKLATHAGLDSSSVTMARAVFRLRSGWGDTMVDVGMTDAIRQKFMTDDVFDAAAMDRVTLAVQQARRIVVTHEHPDHIGLLGQIEQIRSDSKAFYLTADQIAGVAKYSDDGKIPKMIAEVRPAKSDIPTVAAPGVVMLPAPGHTPGSAMFYVLMADGKEILFLGDTAWNMSNIREARGRPRFVQQFLMPEPEDRSAVYDQLSRLVQLHKTEPDLIMIPSHDEENLEDLVEQGILSSQMPSKTNTQVVPTTEP